MSDQADVAILTEEYRSLVGERRPGNRNGHGAREIEAILAERGNWSRDAAEHLMSLASGYGSFMLRNALAVALALEIEDGELGF